MTTPDTTARARIRDNAVLLFGRDGYRATSVRDVATLSGVSAGLVIHHFGSKEGLRRECDDHVVHLISERAELEATPTASVIRDLMADLDSFQPVVDYLARMLVDDSAQATRLFDLLYEETRSIFREGVRNGTMRASRDDDMFSMLLLLGGLAPLLLRHHLTRLFGGDYLSPELLNRLVVPTLELYSNGLYSDSTMLDAALAALPFDERKETPS